MTTPNEKFSSPEPGIDAVVRAQLDAEASRVDAAKMWDRVNAQLAADVAPVTPAKPAEAPAKKKWVSLWEVVAVAALVLVVMIASPDSNKQAQASPAQVVESARAEYSPNEDRCYTQTVQVPRNAPFAHLLDSGRTVTICTRGDRFFVKPGFGGKGAWGREANGRVWIAPLRDDAAARFDEAELLPPMRDVVKIRSLELGPLLDEVLKDFDLSWREPPTHDVSFKITAKRRGEVRPWQIASAELELVEVKKTHMLRSLVLRRELPNGEQVVINFTQMSRAERSDADYTAEGHIDAGKPVYDASRPVLRRRILIQNLGDVLVNGL